jgi:ubiquitin-protein ligase
MLSATAKKRIQADIKNVKKDDIKSQGIFYSMNETDMTKGIAMVVGPTNTPYEGGFYFFDIQFPNDYPFSPPAMTSLTQDGFTRFNPNMYREGKVCLSLINTWHKGERWSGCQTLSTILLSIVSSVLVDMPLQNEPGFETRVKSEQSQVYTRMILHANLQTAVYKMIHSPPTFASEFYDDMAAAFLSAKKRLIDLAVASQDYDNKTEVMDFFRMTVTYKFSSLADMIRDCSPRNPFPQSNVITM